MKRIAILTGGGDCPGINAVIRSVTKTAILDHGLDVIGFYDGFLGLVEDRWMPLRYESVSDILSLGGTILGTNNKVNPMRFAGRGPDGNITFSDRSETVRAVYRRRELDALLCIGGDGTMTIASGLNKLGLNIIGIPKTIDNDLYGTDQTFGFDTAVSIITEAIDRIRTTAASHHRAMVVEVMGRNAGWLALTAGVAGGGDIILIPEIDYDMETVCAKVVERSGCGKKFSIIVAGEGARERGGDVVVERNVKDSAEPIRLGGVGRKVAKEIERRTGVESRVTVLGHLQRGGTPSAYDRVLGTLLGIHAVRLACEGSFGRMVRLNANRIGSIALSDVSGRERTVPPDHPLLLAARLLGTVFGDEITDRAE